MTDIVERLRDNAPADHGLASGDLMREAAAEIVRLRAAFADLVGAVTAEVNEKGGGGYILARLSDARAALEPKPLSHSKPGEKEN